MVVTGQSIELYTDNFATLTFTRPAGETFDDANDVVKFTIARLSGSSPLRQNPLFELSSDGAQIALTTPATDPGVATVTIEETDLPGATFAPAKDVDYHFQVEHTDVLGNPVMIAEGTITLKVNVEETI